MKPIPTISPIEKHISTSEAKDLGDEFVKVYAKFGIKIKICDIDFLRDWIVYHLKTKGSTTEDHLYRYSKDVQGRLGIQQFRLIKYGLTPCIAIADHEIEYPHLQAVKRALIKCSCLIS